MKTVKVVAAIICDDMKEKNKIFATARGYGDLKGGCFWAEVKAGHLELKEAEAAKWLTKNQLDSVTWLPADILLIDQIRKCMK